MDASTTNNGNGTTRPDVISPPSALPTVPPYDSSTILPPPVPMSEPAAKFTATGNDLMEIGATLFQEAEDRLRGSRKKRLAVRLGSKKIAEVPLAAGAIGVLAAAMLAVALTRLTIDFE